MNTGYMPNVKAECNSGLIRLNNFMLEQTEINEYGSLVESIVAQLEELLNPVTTVYSEYDKDNKVLRIKINNANQKVLSIIFKIGGEKLLLTVTPVNDDMYKKMTVERIEVITSLHEASGGALPESVSNAIGRVLSINCY